jgi:hypothetical protein
MVEVAADRFAVAVGVAAVTVAGSGVVVKPVVSVVEHYRDTGVPP